jgi:hypothetical protein
VYVIAVKCLFCKADLPDNCRYCSKCGRLQDVSADDLERVIVCKTCRSANAKGMTTCGSCGATLDPSSVVTYAPPPPGRQPLWESRPKPAPRSSLSPALKIAFILLVISGIATLSSVAMTLVHLSDSSVLEDALSESGFGSDLINAVEGFVMCCVTVMIVAAVFSFVTAFLLRSSKRSLALCLVGAGIAVLGVGPFYASSILAFVALTLIAISGDEFG